MATLIPKSLISRQSAAPAASDSPEVDWKTIDLSDGTVYGTSAIVTARDATSLTIDPGQNASSYLDNSPDNRGDYWFASSAVDLTDWPSNTPAMLMIDVTRADSVPAHGTLIGAMFHNAADPTSAAAYAGTYIRGKTNGDGDGWAINPWGYLGGYGSLWANRQRAVMYMMINAGRDNAIAWETYWLDKDGDWPNVRSLDLPASNQKSFDISGGLWVSVIAGAYQPNSPADAASAHTPIAVRYALVPFGENP